MLTSPLKCEAFDDLEDARSCQKYQIVDEWKIFWFHIYFCHWVFLDSSILKKSCTHLCSLLLFISFILASAFPLFLHCNCYHLLLVPTCVGIPMYYSLTMPLTLIFLIHPTRSYQLLIKKYFFIHKTKEFTNVRLEIDNWDCPLGSRRVLTSCTCCFPTVQLGRLHISTHVMTYRTCYLKISIQIITSFAFLLSYA